MANRPATLTAAAGIEALEGLVVLGAGIFVGVETVVGHPAGIISALALTVFAILVGAGMLAIGRGLFQVKRWGRTPALLTQVFGLILAYYLIHDRQYAFGIPVALACLAGLGTLFSPPTTRALVD